MSKFVQYAMAFTAILVIWSALPGKQSAEALVEIQPNYAPLVGPIEPDHAPRSEFVSMPEPNIDSDELECLAKNIYHEARGESREGKIAVANVTLNRVHSTRFPDTVCGVVHQAVYSRWWLENHNRLVPVRNMCQFSWYCDGKSDRIQLTTLEGEAIKSNVQAWTESHWIATQALLGHLIDITDGATFYYNPSLADPPWQMQMVQTTLVENHRFMKPH